MTKSNEWADDYWVLLAQLYLRKPAGMKAVFSKDMVALATELHIHPRILAARMREMDRCPSPHIERMLDSFREKPRELTRVAGRLRKMAGFNSAGGFYDGVTVNETFESDFRPVGEGTTLTPVALILILALYFRLTPPTMVRETPEVAALARMLKVKPDEVVTVLGEYQLADPCLDRRRRGPETPLSGACHRIWTRYATIDPEELDSLAKQLSDYYR